MYRIKEYKFEILGNIIDMDLEVLNFCISTGIEFRCKGEFTSFTGALDQLIKLHDKFYKDLEFKLEEVKEDERN